MLDYAKIGEMLDKAISETNACLQEIGSEHRLLATPNDDECYEVYMAKKSGKPKTSYPGKNETFLIK